MNKIGLSLETAASVIANDTAQDHMAKFAAVIRRDRVTSQSVAGAYINALAGTIALAIVGGHGSRDEIIDMCVAKLRECVDRDLRHLAGL